MAANTTELEKRLWDAADQLRANSNLKSHEYSVPVLGLIFLRYADHKFIQAKAKLTSKSGGRRTIGKADYQAQGVLYTKDLYEQKCDIVYQHFYEAYLGQGKPTPLTYPHGTLSQWKVLSGTPHRAIGPSAKAMGHWEWLVMSKRQRMDGR